MGIDGFSMSNLGLNRNLTSAQLANEVEATAKQALENQMADVDGVGKKEKAGRKDPDAAFNGTIPFVPDENSQNKDEQQQEQPQPENIPDAINLEDSEDDDADKYHFRVNAANMIEVWDSETKKLIKTVSPQDAINVAMNFSKLPGIFVNKKV